MTAAYWITGNTLDVLRQIPDDSIDVAITSPPFLALRSYLPDDDPAKVHEIGSEPTPGEFIDALLDITEELRRVVAPHGSICVELGDTYAGSGGAGGDYAEGGLRDGQQAFKGAAARSRAIAEGRSSRPARGRRDEKHSRGGDDEHMRAYAAGKRNNQAHDGWPNDKSLTMIPELYRISLAYGFNPLTGRETPRWRCRNVVRWTRPNPPVGALGDKFRPATSDMVIACGTDEAGRTRYFDLDAVRTPSSGDERNPSARATPPGQKARACLDTTNPAGAPPLDWWEIPTSPYKGSHYATFPPALVVRPIDAMCPHRVCTTCGQPSRRITERDSIGAGTVRSRQPGHERPLTSTDAPDFSTSVTVGWTDCGHGTWRTGRVLDPFGGSGTTLAVATGHGRDAIGIDLDTRNTDLARDRIGPMFFHHLTTEQLTQLLEPTEAAA